MGVIAAGAVMAGAVSVVSEARGLSERSQAGPAGQTLKMTEGTVGGTGTGSVELAAGPAAEAEKSSV